MLSKSLLVKLALKALSDALTSVVSVENVDAFLDSTLDKVKVYGVDMLSDYPSVSQPFANLCDKAKEGTLVAEYIVESIESILSPNMAGPETSCAFPAELASVSEDLTHLQLAYCSQE